jgi:hypothetical protein
MAHRWSSLEPKIALCSPVRDEEEHVDQQPLDGIPRTVFVSQRRLEPRPPSIDLDREKVLRVIVLERARAPRTHHCTVTVTDAP